MVFESVLKEDELTAVDRETDGRVKERERGEGWMGGMEAAVINSAPWVDHSATCESSAASGRSS